MNKLRLLLLFLITSSYCVAQDTAYAKWTDSILKPKKKFIGRRDIKGDTVIIYGYDSKTHELFAVQENLQSNRRLIFDYRYWEGQLRRVTAYYKSDTKKGMKVRYYFQGNRLVHTDNNGVKADQADYFLVRGNNFLRAAPERFRDPKFN